MHYKYDMDKVKINNIKVSSEIESRHSMVISIQPRSLINRDDLLNRVPRLDVRGEEING